jgi:hypothetical protein
MIMMIIMTGKKILLVWVLPRRSSDNDFSDGDSSVNMDNLSDVADDIIWRKVMTNGPTRTSCLSLKVEMQTLTMTSFLRQIITLFNTSLKGSGLLEIMRILIY